MSLVWHSLWSWGLISIKPHWTRIFSGDSPPFIAPSPHTGMRCKLWTSTSFGRRCPPTTPPSSPYGPAATYNHWLSQWPCELMSTRFPFSPHWPRPCTGITCNRCWPLRVILHRWCDSLPFTERLCYCRTIFMVPVKVKVRVRVIAIKKRIYIIYTTIVFIVKISISTIITILISVMHKMAAKASRIVQMTLTRITIPKKMLLLKIMLTN